MKRKVNLASTENIRKSDLDKLMKEVSVTAQKKSTLAKSKLHKEIQKEIQNAKNRFKK
jgi:hypothetical protein